MFKFKDGLFEPKTKEKIVKDTFFGGAEKAAAKKQEKAGRDAQALTRKGVEEARADINRLFPQAQQTAQQGFQGALDVFGQSLPAQTDVFTQGNVGAQQAILAGLPQMQNALLGNNIDYSQMQPFEVQQPDTGFFQQTLPQIQQQQSDAQLNNGLGGFDPNNPAFNGQIGPFQAGQNPLAGNFNFSRFNRY